MKKILLPTFLSTVLSISAFSQEIPLFATYMLDKYLFNPSYLAEDGYSQINLVHRRVWVNIDDAPVISGLNAQLALSPKISIGLNFINDNRILLSKNTALATFGYKVFLSRHHRIQFGLSTGASFNQLDIDDVDDSVDPALSNTESNQTYVQGQFGMSYTFKGFTAGITLPRLLREEPFSDENEDLEFSQMDNLIVNSSYRFELSPFINLEPYGLYAVTSDEFDFYEIGMLGQYKDLFKIGAFYRENRGIGLLTQISVANNLSLAYAYEEANTQNLSFGGSTHEIQLKLRFGKRVTKTPTITTASTVNEPLNSISQQEGEDERIALVAKNNETDLKQDTTPKATENLGNHLVDETDIEDSIENKSEIDAGQDLAKNEVISYYLVVGAFEIEENAQKFYSQTVAEYPTAGIVYVANKGLYYVFMETVAEQDVSVEKINQVRNTTIFKGAWFMKKNL